MKKQLILAGLLVVGYASAQEGNVGINTSTPQATLDITANTADGDKVEGLMIPRITYAKMQAMKANLTEKHDGLMVYVTDYVEGGNSKDGVYRPSSYSPYFVYNGVAKEFLPFSPSGLTEVKNATGGGNSYVLANKALFHKTSQTPTELGLGAIDLSTDETSTLRAQGDYSFAAQGGTASGSYATAIGHNTKVSGSYAAALGQGAAASGTYAVALGQSAIAKGGNSFAALGAIAEGPFSVALGHSATAKGSNSFAVQRGTASGGYATAIGYEAKASGGYATAIGSYTNASGLNTAALGYGTSASGTHATAVGFYSNARGNNSFAAQGATTTNLSEIAFGYNFNTDTDVEVGSITTSPTRQIFSVGGQKKVISNALVINQNALIILRNAHTGIGLPTDTATPANSKPTEMLDVNGNIRVRGTAGITAGGACTNLGTITFSGDNFYGCKSTGWVRLNN